MECNHKEAGKCKFCNKARKPKSKCKICGSKRFSSTCRVHMSNGGKIPRTRGKATTKSVKKRREIAFNTKRLSVEPPTSTTEEGK